MMKQKTKKNLRVAFFGTPYFAVYALEELEKARMAPALVVSVPDKPAGRGLAMTASPVKTWTVEKGIDVVTPERLNESDAEADILFNSEWDLFIVAGYGKLLSKKVLSLPRYGVLNIHPSLLPKFRGPSPIETAILEDTKETGVSIILLDEEVDHGPVIAQASVTPEPWPFKRSALEDLLWHAGGELLAETIPQWVERTLKAEPQDESKATFTKKIEKEDGLLDLAGDAYQNYLKFCAYEGWPGTYFFATRSGKKIRVKIADAEFAGGEFRVLRVIPEGKQEMDYTDFARNL